MAAVIAIVIAVLLYRLAVAGLIYQAVSGLPLGPSVGDIIVAITGAGLQLIAIIVMNKIYEFLAFKLTNWGMEWGLGHGMGLSAWSMEWGLGMEWGSVLGYSMGLDVWVWKGSVLGAWNGV